MSPTMLDAMSRIKSARVGLALVSAAVAAVGAGATGSLEGDTVKLALVTPKDGERLCPLTGKACPVDARTSAKTIYRALSDATSRLEALLVAEPGMTIRAPQEPSEAV